LGGTGIWTQGLCLPGRFPITWDMLPALFALVTFEIGSHILPGLAWTVLLIMLPAIADMASMHNHIQLFSFKMESHEFFSWAILELWSSWSQPTTQLWWQVHTTLPSYWFNMESCEHFPRDWPWTVIPLISTFQETRITGVSHQHLATSLFDLSCFPGSGWPQTVIFLPMSSG
jgi:hypothetical protein